MKNFDDNDIKNYILQMVEYSHSPIYLSKDIIFDEIFKPIPRPTVEEMDARMILSSKNIKVDPIHPDAGKSQDQQFKDWCKRNNIEVDYDFISQKYRLKRFHNTGEVI